LSAGFLCIGGIKDLVPKRPLTIFGVFPFHHQAFKITFLDQLEKLQRILVYIANASDRIGFTWDDFAENLFALKQRQPAEIAPVQPEKIEGVIDGLALSLH